MDEERVCDCTPRDDSLKALTISATDYYTHFASKG